MSNSAVLSKGNLLTNGMLLDANYLDLELPLLNNCETNKQRWSNTMHTHRNANGDPTFAQVDSQNRVVTASGTVGAKAFASGPLGATTKIVALASAGLPLSLTLNSADATRKIELSTNGGNEYFTPSVNTSSTTMQVVVVSAPATHARFTGLVADTFWVQ